MKAQVLAGNWKMFKTRAETKAFFKEIGTELATTKIRKIVAPSPTLLETAVGAAQGTGIEIFAQNMGWAESGAFTGETSPDQLLELGVKGTLIAHSERRQYFGETDETAVKKAVLALAKGLDVIYCIGEKIEERKANQTDAVLRKQLAPVLETILPKLAAQGPAFLIAYEPVWAIGTGLTATPEQVKDTHAGIATLLKNSPVPLPILYGGSVKTDNFGGLVTLPHVNGGLVGGASLTSDSYRQLHQIFASKSGQSD